jgi:hypothetical protein
MFHLPMAQLEEAVAVEPKMDLAELAVLRLKLFQHQQQRSTEMLAVIQQQVQVLSRVPVVVVLALQAVQ